MLFELIAGDVIPYFHFENLEVELGDSVLDVIDDDVVGPIARAIIKSTKKEIWISLDDLPEIFLGHLSLKDIEKYRAVAESRTATLN